MTPDRIFEVSERIDVTGQCNMPSMMTTAGADRATPAAARRAVDCHRVPARLSRNPREHEQQAARLIAQILEAVVSLSSEVLPQFREFERSMATVLNAAVMPHVSRYLDLLRGKLDATPISTPLLIMKSNGGVTSAETAARRALRAALSGPAAGVIGAVSVAHSAGFSDIISIDVGGTSADICLVRDRQPEIFTQKAKIGPFPLKIPIIDINTVGAGGGSVRTVLGPSRLEVGPRGAGTTRTCLLRTRRRRADGHQCRFAPGAPSRGATGR